MMVVVTMMMVVVMTVVVLGWRRRRRRGSWWSKLCGRRWRPYIIGLSSLGHARRAGTVKTPSLRIYYHWRSQSFPGGHNKRTRVDQASAASTTSRTHRNLTSIEDDISPLRRYADGEGRTSNAKRCRWRLHGVIVGVSTNKTKGANSGINHHLLDARGAVIDESVELYGGNRSYLKLGLIQELEFSLARWRRRYDLVLDNVLTGLQGGHVPGMRCTNIFDDRDCAANLILGQDPAGKNASGDNGHNPQPFTTHEDLTN
jgi:hypothetical protein